MYGPSINFPHTPTARRISPVICRQRQTERTGGKRQMYFKNLKHQVSGHRKTTPHSVLSLSSVHTNTY
uniref:Uncharacterized protein n=1 Tax=Anguilla anguilla TaxID=7936 RepID=A0A0E9PHQ8_ANGAN